MAKTHPFCDNPKCHYHNTLISEGAGAIKERRGSSNIAVFNYPYLTGYVAGVRPYKATDKIIYLCENCHNAVELIRSQ